MPPKKRNAGPRHRSKRLRPLPPASDLPEAEPAAIVQDTQSTPVPGIVRVNLQALTSTIAPAVSAPVRDAMATQHQASVPGNTATALGQVEHLVDEFISNLTQPTGTQSVIPNFLTWVLRMNPASFLATLV